MPTPNAEPTVTREEVRAYLEREVRSMERSAETARLIGWSATLHLGRAALCRAALAALEDAERYRFLCEWREWAEDIEAAFDCGDKLAIDAAIDRARGAGGDI